MEGAQLGATKRARRRRRTSFCCREFDSRVDHPRVADCFVIQSWPLCADPSSGLSDLPSRRACGARGATRHDRPARQERRGAPSARAGGHSGRRGGEGARSPCQRAELSGCLPGVDTKRIGSAVIFGQLWRSPARQSPSVENCFRQQTI